ncbi:1,4-alpha-glucan branching protein [Streptomyces sp. NPDC021093]|uniref:maltokinase N-terminal cap-like domain-containing protein n=1 Tax=Streptomyces sp. NPDC021093 TaxID=3365112 RepID=UPI00379431FA
MASIHRTTMTPTKLELLTAWLPTRPWYLGTSGTPELTKAGGFRLDDPEGEVGIEFMVVTDGSGDHPVSYHVPLSYRAAPLEGADQGFVGTSEHGVLGRRWLYDGTHDPVLVGQLLALLQHRAEPQAQSQSDTPDPSVTVSSTGVGPSGGLVSATVNDGEHGTAVTVRTEATAAGQSGEAAGPLILAVTRVLSPAPEGEGPDSGAGAGSDSGARAVEAGGAGGALGHVTGNWRSPDGSENRAAFATLYTTAGQHTAH